MIDSHLTQLNIQFRQLLAGCFVASTVLAVSGCGVFEKNQDSAPDKVLDWNSIPNATPRIEPLSKTGNPTSYVVNGKRYYVKLDAQDHNETGLASWYGTKFHGNLTSSGEPYDMYQMTAAHKSLPLPSYVSVTNLENDRHIIVKVNDRGPFVEGRIIDLSYAAAQKLEIVRNGTAKVAIKVLAAPDTNIQGAATNGQDTLQHGIARTYYIQLGAFSEIGNAERFKKQLTLQSIEPTLIKSYSDDDGDLHKVQVGPMQSIEDLQSIESQLTELGYEQLFIVTE